MRTAYTFRSPDRQVAADLVLDYAVLTTVPPDPTCVVVRVGDVAMEGLRIYDWNGAILDRFEVADDSLSHRAATVLADKFRARLRSEPRFRDELGRACLAHYEATANRSHRESRPHEHAV